MKKRIIGLILILPFVVMLLAFGFSRTVSLVIDLTAEFLVCNYDDQSVFEFDAAALENGYLLEAQAFPVNAVNTAVNWEITEETDLEGTKCADGEVAEIETDGGKSYLKKKKDGCVGLRAYVADSPAEKRFKAYLIDSDNGDASGPKLIVVNGEDKAQASVRAGGDCRYYGTRDLRGDSRKFTEVAAVATFTAAVYPKSAQTDLVATAVYADPSDEGAVEVLAPKPSGDAFEIKVNVNFASAGKITVNVNTQDGSVRSTPVVIKAVEGINVRTYDELMYCTSSDHPRAVVLHRNFESASNLAAREQAGATDSVLFGRRESAGSAINGKIREKRSKNGVYCQYTTVDYTYFHEFFDIQGWSTKDVLYAAVIFRDNVYGNGYTINAHELTFPSETVNGLATPNSDDPYAGPQLFVEAGGCACYGQDNIGFLVEGDGIVIDNVTLQNCNNSDNLSNFNNVGTVVEVRGDDVRITNSQLRNGRTVLRTMSNENLLVESCILSFSREFILKIGSNNCVYPRRDLSEFTYASLSPERDDNGKPISDLTDSTATVRNTYFHTCGVFCIGMDTHFAGNLLYVYAPANIHNMAATSYPSALTLEGDVKFYDWKKVSGLDSSTLIGTSGKYEGLFNVSDVINNFYNNNPDSHLLYSEEGGKEKWVHGGIAFFGGGRNLSTVDYSGLDPDCLALFGDDSKDDDNDPDYFRIALDDNDLQLNPLLVRAAGYGPFKFRIYKSDVEAAIALLGKIPSPSAVSQYAVEV